MEYDQRAAGCLTEYFNGAETKTFKGENPDLYFKCYRNKIVKIQFNELTEISGFNPEDVSEEMVKANPGFQKFEEQLKKEYFEVFDMKVTMEKDDRDTSSKEVPFVYLQTKYKPSLDPEY